MMNLEMQLELDETLSQEITKVIDKLNEGGVYAYNYTSTKNNSNGLVTLTIKANDVLDFYDLGTATHDLIKKYIKS